MDLPPPPPPPLLRHQHHHHLRYGNVLHPPDFIPPPCSHHLPPPPPPTQPLPPHIRLPPPPPRSPPRNDLQPLNRPRFNLSRPKPPILERPHRERPYHHEFEPTKPYFRRNLLPPSSPREKLPVRIIPDYPERNPMFRDEISRRGCGDENWDQNLHWGARELRNRVPDVGDREKYRAIPYHGLELYKRIDDDGRIWENRVKDWSRDRDYDNRGLGSSMSGRGYELFNERDREERRLGSGTRGHELYNVRGHDGRRLDSCRNDQSCELYTWKDDDWSWGGVSNDRGCELFTEQDDCRNRQPEFMQDNMGLGRFAGRLGRRVPEEEFIRSNKKRRVQKKKALRRIPLGKYGSKHNGTLKHQNIPKKSSSSSFGGKEKEGFQLLQTKTEDKKEREQSPMELAISFKSNALVAKAILAPSNPAVKSGIDLTNVNDRIVYNMSDSPLVKSSNDVVNTHCLTHGLDLRSQSHGNSTEALDKAPVSGSGCESASVAIGLGENSIKNEPPRCIDSQGPVTVGSGRTRLRRRLRKKRRSRKQRLHEISMQKEKERGNITNTNHQSNSPAAVPELNLDTTLSKGNQSSAFAGVVPDTVLFSSLVGIVSEKGESERDSDKSFLPNLKRKRGSLTTLTASSYVADNVINECSGHAENSVTTTAEADHLCQLGIDGVGGHAHRTLLVNESTDHGDSLTFNQHDKDVSKFAQIGASVLHSKKSASIGQSTGLGTDEYLTEFHESDSSLESDSRLLQRPKCVIISDGGYPDANLEELHRDQVNTPQAPVHAVEVRSPDGVVRDCSNVNIGISTSSDVLSADRKRIVAQFGVSFPDALGEKSSIDVDSVEGSPEAISNMEACSRMDYSSKVIRKRKARSAQEGVYCSSSDVVVGTVSSIGGEVAKLVANDLVPDVEVDLVENDTCKEDDLLNRELSEVEDTTLEVDSGANGLCSNYRKKRKGSSPRSNLLSLLEDDTVAGGVDSDCSGLVLRSITLAEWGAEQEDSPSGSTSTTECAINNMEEKVVCENFYVGDLENLADVNKLHTNGDQALFANSLSSFADINGVAASNFREDLLASGFDMGSCMSSPEERLSYSDLIFSRNVACQSENGEFIKIAAADNSQTNAELSPSLPEDSSKTMKTSNFVHGKLASSKNQRTVPKVFPDHHPSNFSNSRKFQYTHATKSRTWCRPGNSVTFTEPKSQPSLLPPSHGTKLARTVQSSYIRKGNSLVRNPSPSGVTPTGVHGSGSSVYRLTPCTDNLKNSLESDSKTGDANAPTLMSIKQSNTSEFLKAPPLNHTGKSVGSPVCNSKDSLPVADPPRNGCHCKTLDGLKETIKSSAVPECQTDSVNNPDSQSKLEGNLEKKILYVKRRSNQLIAASSSSDTSISGVDKTQASLSDGYYKSRKNQLVRSSPENHVKKEDANVNLRKLVPHIILPRTSNRRVSGFAKSCRKSKFSLVWKLHDKQSSEKHKNSVVPRKVWPHLFPWKRATYLRHALGTKPSSNSLSTTSQKLLLSRKRGAIYTRSTHGYSLRMSKVLSVGASSLKWSKSIERNSKMANEEATRAVAAAEKRKKEETGAVPIAIKSRNHVSRERIFRIGSERYKMDPTRRTLHRITAEKEPSSSVLQSEKNVKRSYVPRRLLICNEEYVRIGNGNQLIRDPKKRTRVLASEKVRWSLRTARLRLARKKKYCQFFTRYGKCNKDDGKCLYIHDPSKIAVCTKFLSGSCSNLDCKLTHKIIPERMQDCSYFLKGSCSNENCPYRHVNVNPDWTVCRNFLRGYCADGNECRKKHTYVCPAFESTGICPRASTCKLHHPKPKIETKPESEQKKIVRGRYFDGGLIGVNDCTTPEKHLPAKGKDGIGCHEGNFPDYISLVVSDDEVEPTLASEDVLSDMEISDLDESIQPSPVLNRGSVTDSSLTIDSRNEMMNSLFL